MPFSIIHSDITKVKCDAVVNAANRSLLGGGGVDGAIHRAAGPELLAECRTLGGCETGEAKATKGYGLGCRYIIHTVGPVWQGGGSNEEQLLYSCYINSLKLASELGCESVAFPLISAGVYGYPLSEAVSVALRAFREYLNKTDEDMQIILVAFDRKAVKLTDSLYMDVKSYIDAASSESASVGMSAFLEKAGRIFPKMHDSKSGIPITMNGFEAEEKRNRCFREDRMDDICEADSFDFSDDPFEIKDETFSDTLMKMIDGSGLTDPEVYHRANIDRRLFSKIRCDRFYRPKKQTVLAFAIALELDMEHTADLLEKAGYVLSDSIKGDVIVKYFIEKRRYDIFEINETLFAFDQTLIGC